MWHGRNPSAGHGRVTDVTHSWPHYSRVGQAAPVPVNSDSNASPADKETSVDTPRQRENRGGNRLGCAGDCRAIPGFLS